MAEDYLQQSAIVRGSESGVCNPEGQPESAARPNNSLYLRIDQLKAVAQTTPYLFVRAAIPPKIVYTISHGFVPTVVQGSPVHLRQFHERIRLQKVARAVYT